MENVSNSSSLLKAYVALLKPGILFGNAVTMTGGFALAAKAAFPLPLFLITFLGLCLVIASACTFNNCIDLKADQLMTRTKKRPLATGALSMNHALLFASISGLLGATLLYFRVNFLAFAIASLGFAIYVFCYSFAKYYTTYATLIGSIAGAIPPVIGYCAFTNQIDLGAYLLFAIITLWQMPHFYAIAIYRIEDYAAASIPVLPLKKGIKATQHHMIYYIIAFTLASSLLTVYGYTNLFYLIMTAVLGVVWLAFCLRGFSLQEHKIWARKMFIFSLVVVMVLCSVIPFSLATAA